MENFWVLKKVLFVFDEQKLQNSLVIRKNLLYTVLGTVMGGLVCSFKGIHTYNNYEKWNGELAVSYYLGPWITIILGIAFYSLFTESFISITIGKENILSNSTSSLGMGFLIGLSWYNFVIKIIKISDRTSVR
jgi:hypothetical protein